MKDHTTPPKSDAAKLPVFNLEQEASNWIKHHGLKGLSFKERQELGAKVKLVFDKEDLEIMHFNWRHKEVLPSKEEQNDIDSAKGKFDSEIIHPVMGKAVQLNEKLKHFMETKSRDDKNKSLETLASELHQKVKTETFEQSFVNKGLTPAKVSYNQEKASGRVFSWGLDVGFTVSGEVGLNAGLVSATMTIGGSLDTSIGIQRSEDRKDTMGVSYEVLPGYKSFYRHNCTGLNSELHYELELSGSFLVVFKTSVIYNSTTQTFAKPTGEDKGHRLHFIPVAVLFSQEYFDSKKQEFKFNKKVLPAKIRVELAKINPAKFYEDKDIVRVRLEVKKRVMDVESDAERDDVKIEGYEEWLKLQSYKSPAAKAAITAGKTTEGSSEYDVTDTKVKATSEALSYLMMRTDMSLAEVNKAFLVTGEEKRVLSRGLEASLAVLFKEKKINIIFTDEVTSDDVETRLLRQLPEVDKDTTANDREFVLTLVRVATSEDFMGLSNEEKLIELNELKEKFEKLPKKLTKEALEAFERDERANRKYKGVANSLDIKRDASKSEKPSTKPKVSDAVIRDFKTYVLKAAELEKMYVSGVKKDFISNKIKEIFELEEIKSDVDKEFVNELIRSMTKNVFINKSTDEKLVILNDYLKEHAPESISSPAALMGAMGMHKSSGAGSTSLTSSSTVDNPSSTGPKP